MKAVRTLVLLGMLAVFPAAAFSQISIGICTGVQNAQQVRDAGGDFIEENVSGFLMPLKTDDEFAANLALAKASPLPILSCKSFFPADFRLVGAEKDHERALAYAETAFRRAGQAGIPYLVLGSGRSRRIPEGYDPEQGMQDFTDLLRAMGALAARHGVTVVVEPLNSRETNLINSVAEGVALVKRVDHPNVRCLADIYHMMVENEGPQVLRQQIEYIGHCHVAEKEGRTAPGTRGEDLSPYYRALIEAGYRGGLSVEAGWQDFDGQLAPAIALLKEQTAQ